MKKRMFFLIASVLFTVCAFSAEKLITFEQMPKQAQEFANRAYKENNKNESRCYQFEDRFDYHGIKKALCGKTAIILGHCENFTTKRILVIQMK